MGQKAPKINLSVRVSESGVEWLDKVAAEERVDRSDVIRAALVLGTKEPARLRKIIEDNL